MIDRNNAMELLNSKVKNKNLVKHCIAVEAIMLETALDLKSNKDKKEIDEEKWAIAGLVHDIDYEETFNDPLKHSLVGSLILQESGYDEDIIYAVKVHNNAHGIKPESLMDIALSAADPISGLIAASALITKAKKINEIDEDFVLKRYKEKSFAKGADRKQIMMCENIGYSLREFINISLRAMKKIDKQLGL